MKRALFRLHSPKKLSGDFLDHYKKNKLPHRIAYGAMATLILGTVITQNINLQRVSGKYDISSFENILLEEPVSLYDQKLQPSGSSSLVFNEGYQIATDIAGQGSSPKYIAKFNEDGTNTVSVNDPLNNINFGIKPLFPLQDPIKNKNRVVMPLLGKKATKIYTLQGTAVKEDLVLSEYQGDTLEYDYQLILEEDTVARLDDDGSVGVYGVDPVFLGQVSTSSESDEELLKKVKENADKTTLLFKIPAPFIVEPGKQVSKAKAWFSMPEKNVLRVHAADLQNAHYPLSIDPSIYIETARKLMRGNNETNVDFNTSNELIQKGSTTGARFDNWINTTALNEGRAFGATAVAGGFIYSVGGSTQGGLVKNSYTTATSSTNYTVPAGVTTLSIKSWGGAGGGGGSSPDRIGGDGGGGGYASSTIPVTPGETLTIRVGGGGSGGSGFATGTNSGNGGGGGGYSGVFRGATPLIIASGGGGGGGGNGDSGSTARAPGSDGAAGGGDNGSSGNGNGDTTGGSGGTSGAGGAGGNVAGTNGGSLAGGAGGNPSGGAVSGGGVNGGGNGGVQQNGGGPNKRPAGGGGGSGYFGGGGGGYRNAQYNGGAGGGSGSSYTTGSPATKASGNGRTPANVNDDDRAGNSDGGTGGVLGGNGVAGDPGTVVVSYSTGGAGAVQDEVYWAQLNETTGAISTPNPGDGSCVNWCTRSIYSLPSERQAHSMVAYNGFLYVFGGKNDNGTIQNTVYIAKLGANGEPQKWHPNDPTPADKSDWVYWHQDTSLTEELAYHSAVAYNNRIYLIGGQNTSSASSQAGISTVRSAAINPTGTLSSWTTTGMNSLPSTRFGHTSHAYNGYLYTIGGNTAGTLKNTVEYAKINADGSISNWILTSSFTTPRSTAGGVFSTVWGGYLYINGGCSALTGSGYCNTVLGDTQLASINADGTLSDWGSINGLTNLRIGHTMVAWRNAVYAIGGCNAQNSLNGQCLDLILTNDYGSVNQDGDASTVSDSQPSGSGSCVGADPYNCDIPPLGDGNGLGGQMAGGAVINNGYIYYIGGCTTSGAGNLCSQGGGGRTASTTSYAAISSDGTLRRPTCTGANKQYYGSWCVDNSNRINNGNGLAAFGFTVFNNTIYAIGGTTGSTWQSNVWRTSLAPDGSLSGWTSQTFANTGLGDAKGYQYVFSRANPAASSTFPGNLYVIGGCNGTVTGVDCNSTIYSTVYKCKISTTGELGTGADICTTSGQLQLDSEPGTAGIQGLGVMAGTVYANYIYLIGGQSPNEAERGEVIYAKIDNNNNIVAASGSEWVISPNELSPQRRRGVAFGYNGYLYGLAGFATDTGLNDLLFAKIDVSNGSIGAFTTSNVTVNPRWDLRAVVSSGYVYTLGGCSSGEPPAECLAMTSTVQTFQLYNNYSGSTKSYTTSPNLFATDRLAASAAVVGGKMYVAGGCTDAACTTVTNSVQVAMLGNDGTVGSWSAATNLPQSLAYGQLEASGDSLYYIGGENASAQAQTTVYRAAGASGTLSAWTTTTSLPVALTGLGASVWNGRIYLTGGHTNGTRRNTVYYSSDISNGGGVSSWTTTTSFNTARSGHVSMSYAGNLYVLGGTTGSSVLSDVQFAKVNSDGTVGTFNYTTSLPQPVRNADGFARNGYMYIFGGRTSSNTVCTGNTYVTPISANTSISSGNNPTGVGDWYQTRSSFNGIAKYGVAAVYNEGKAYLLGGGCGSSITYSGADRVQRATLQSQPQVAHYSRMIDTDSNVFPTKWLLNGLDNDIGARWRLKYQSSTNENNAWGAVTNFGTVQLGNVETYIPKNGGGVNTNFARYYYFDISIDSSQAYGYPDDVTRGPTIDDLTLFFTADPNKRLRHGKTFTGGNQQPLDTPPPN